MINLCTSIQQLQHCLTVLKDSFDTVVKTEGVEVDVTMKAFETFLTSSVREIESWGGSGDNDKITAGCLKHVEMKAKLVEGRKSTGTKSKLFVDKVPS